jgi:hypothetical protein
MMALGSLALVGCPAWLADDEHWLNETDETVR